MRLLPCLFLLLGIHPSFFNISFCPALPLRSPSKKGIINRVQALQTNWLGQIVDAHSFLLFILIGPKIFLFGQNKNQKPKKQQSKKKAKQKQKSQKSKKAKKQKAEMQRITKRKGEDVLPSEASYSPKKKKSLYFNYVPFPPPPLSCRHQIPNCITTVKNWRFYFLISSLLSFAFLQS